VNYQIFKKSFLTMSESYVANETNGCFIQLLLECDNVVEMFISGKSARHALHIRISLLGCKERQTNVDKQSSVQYRRL
jgi:hypothetical protein